MLLVVSKCLCDCVGIHLASLNLEAYSKRGTANKI